MFRHQYQDSMRIRQSMNKSLLIAAFQQSYRNKRVAAQIYRAFAEREPRETHRAVLQVLVENAERSAAGYASRLLRLGVLPPLNVNRLGAWGWQWLLICCGVRWAVGWVEWVEKRDLHRYVTLFETQTQRQTSADCESCKTETFRQGLLKHYNLNSGSRQ